MMFPVVTPACSKNRTSNPWPRTFKTRSTRGWLAAWRAGGSRPSLASPQTRGCMRPPGRGVNLPEDSDTGFAVQVWQFYNIINIFILGNRQAANDPVILTLALKNRPRLIGRRRGS